MSAFLICDVMVNDGDKLREYPALSEHTLKPYGGHFHAQAGEIENLEGEWQAETIIIAEFPSIQRARDWYHSAEYAKALTVKPAAMDRNLILTATPKSKRSVATAAIQGINQPITSNI